MSQGINIRNALLRVGFFPEVLPPCFDSYNMARSFKGMIKGMELSKFHKKSSAYIRYSGTKHDGNRRYYGTVNPIPYFHICHFIGHHWKIFTDQLNSSLFGLSSFSIGGEKDDRALLIPALSEITSKMSSKIKYAPYIIKTDIAQFFPSIYTHSLAWVAHGVQIAKADTDRSSRTTYFNNLDWFTQQCQNGQTRGVIVGPDAFRVIAEYIACEIDKLLCKKAKDYIVGGVRHVDDFYIGVRSELDGSIVLSHLRDILQNFELQINDNKTKLLSGLQPIDDIWAQELRNLYVSNAEYDIERFNYILDKAFEVSQRIGSQSPMKLVLRKLDKGKCYLDESWIEIEPKLQRILFHFPHCLDYSCLLVAKRIAIKKDIDNEGWKNVIELIIKKSIGANHHHEILWLVWLAFVCKIKLSDSLLIDLSKSENGYVKAILIAGHQAGLCNIRSLIKLGNNLSTDDEKWLHHLVARSSGYSSARFSGPFARDFENLVSRKIRIIDFNKHMKTIANIENEAISRSKYGYDSEKDDGEEDTFAFDIDW
ncbi:RNA-directed DNA polymerase [Pedobacter sp. UYP1]|uniref:RNA-directed DNA polymerase n=1 Tax=Pedobacter sp. UYP1 TaxID=1756396 RepID=UPI0033914A15